MGTCSDVRIGIGMGIIYAWVKNIVYFYIFITAVLHMLPKDSYQKYVRFFCGMILVVMLLTPILNIIYKKDYLEEKISYENFWQEMDNMQLDIEKIEAIHQEAYLLQYEAAIGEDISLMAEENEIYVNQIQVTLKEDYTIKQVAMSVHLTPKGGIYMQKIVLSDNSFDYPQVAKLKEKLTTFYHISEEQIQIAVQEE
ncbi:stage III sporulation protein AF [Lachnospiraceae bacterium ZAX-1]